MIQGALAHQAIYPAPLYSKTTVEGSFPMWVVYALNSPSGVQNKKNLVRSYFSGSVVSLADTYQCAAGFGVTGAHNNLSGCIIWAVPNWGHTHLERIFLISPPPCL